MIGRRLLYWDTCVFLAWIKNETCWPEDVTKGIEQSVEEWRARHLVIGTSSITILEILSSRMTTEHKDAFAKVFADPNLQLIDVDRRIAGKASAIRSAYDNRKFLPDGSCIGSIMGMGDAIHLATAIHFEAYEFQTLDGSGARKRRTDLLKLDGDVAGARLSIKLPKYIPPPEPLSGPVTGVEGAQPGLFDTNANNEETNEIKPEPTKLLGSGDGHPEGQAGAEAAERGDGKEAGKE